jgi:hypothetical protein
MAGVNLGFSTALTISILDSMGNSSAGQSFWDSGVLEIRSGTRPVSADTAPTGTVLASMTLPADAMGATSGHTMSFAGTWSDPSADATGTASWFRIKRSGDSGTTNTTDKRLDGDCGTTGSGFDMELNNLSIAITQVVNCASYSHTLPA